MKTILAVVVGLVIAGSTANASAQIFFGPAVPAPAVVVAPPVPVVTAYAAPVVAYTPGYVFSAGPVRPAPLYYSLRQRTNFRGPYYRSTVRFRGW